MLGADDGPKPVQVSFDGKPIPDDVAGADVKDGVAAVDRQKLYSLVDLPKVEQGRPQSEVRARGDRLRVHVRLGESPRRAVRPACGPDNEVVEELGGEPWLEYSEVSTFWSAVSLRKANIFQRAAPESGSAVN